MKRLTLILLALIVSAASAMAQDIITKRNGEDIKAKVLEIDNTNVKYKLYDEPDGVTYTMRKSEILMIRYSSGRNEVFNTSPATSYGYGMAREPIADLRAGMKYKDLKNIYNHKEYVSGVGDKHSPALMGVCSWIIPGLGQMISGEVGRGCGWLGGAIGSSVVMGIGSGLISSAVDDYYYDDYDAAEAKEIAGGVLIAAGAVALLTVDICAIVDAVRVARVRNMYEQDLRKMNYSFELHPSVDYIRTPSGSLQPTAGLALAMKF